MIRLSDTHRRNLTLDPRNIWQGAIVVVVGSLLGLIAASYALIPDPYNMLFIGGLFGLCALVIIGEVRRLLLVVMMIDIPLQFDVNFFYRLEAAQYGAEGGLNLSLTTACVLILYALWIAELLTKKRRMTVPSLKYAVPLGIYVLLVAVSLVYAQDKQLAVFEIFMIFQTFLIYIYILGTVRDQEDVQLIYAGLMLSLIITGITMVGAWAVGDSVTIAGITSRVDPGRRVGGTVGSPNNAGGFLVMLMLPAIGGLVSNINRRYKILAVVGLLLGMMALIFTQSRGGWAAFGVATSMFGLLAWWRGWISTTTLVSPVIVVVIIAAIFQNTILTRLTADDNGSFNSRFPLMEMTFRVLDDHPILGVGANNLAIAIQDYVTPDLGRGVWVYAVHNKYLLVWSETGLFSLIAFLSFLVITIWWGWRTWLTKDRMLSPLAFGFALSIMGVMTHMFVDLFHSRPDTQQLWLNAAMIAVLYRMINDRITE